MKAYYTEEHLLYKGHFRVALAMEVYDVITAAGPTSSSFTILASRLFSMPHDKFLAMIRQDYGAALHGNVGYVTYTFPNRLDAERLVKELNKRWNCLMFVKDGKPAVD